MKRRFYLAATLLLGITIVGCTGNKKADIAATSTDTTQVTDMHTAENSLDYFGRYTGTTPAADCPGIDQVLVLNKDYTFTLNYSYIDRDVKVDEAGTFSIEGNIITTQNKEGHKSYYQVGEGYVSMLMADKQPVTGELAEHYILKKSK